MFWKTAPAEAEKASAQELQFAPGILTELCNRVLASQKASRKGSVLGFVLFGRSKGLNVVVEATREFASSHIFGSRSTESLVEEEQLISVMVSTRTDAQLDGMEAVGWSWSHPRNELTLDDEELSVFQKFFPDPGQIALKLKRVDDLHVDAGLFVRTSAGHLNPEDPSAVLHLQKGEGLAPERREVAPTVFARDRNSLGNPSQQLTSSQQLPGNGAVATNLQHGREPEIERQSQKPPAVENASTTLLQLGPVLRTACVCAVGLMAGLLLAVWREHATQNVNAMPDSVLTMNLAPDAGNLVLTWQSKLNDVSSAKMEILDGDSVLHFDLTRGFEQHGLFVFPHESGNVQTTLTVTTPQGILVRRAGYSNASETIAHARVLEAAQHEREVRIQAREQTGSMDTSNRRLAAMLAYLKDSHRKK